LDHSHLRFEPETKINDPQNEGAQEGRHQRELKRRNASVLTNAI